MATAKEALLEQIQNMPDTGEFIVYGSGRIVHINQLDNGDLFLSAEEKVGLCRRCGIAVVSTIDGMYDGYCPNHDEDLFRVEIEPIPE